MLTVYQVAKELSVHPQSVYRWIRQGKLKALKIYGVVRIEEAELQRFIHALNNKGGK